MTSQSDTTQDDSQIPLDGTAAAAGDPETERPELITREIDVPVAMQHEMVKAYVVSTMSIPSQHAFFAELAKGNVPIDRALYLAVLNELVLGALANEQTAVREAMEHLDGGHVEPLDDEEDDYIEGGE